VEGSLIFLFAAAIVVLVAIVGYLIVLSGRLSSLQRELDALKQSESWADDEHPSNERR
jgi:CcmD family protein